MQWQYKLLLGLLLCAVWSFSNVTENGVVSFNYPVTSVVKPAQSSDFIIEADHISYVSNNEVIQATGNVVVGYKDVQLTANHTTINIEQNRVYISSGFVLNRSAQEFSGEDLQYDFMTGEGLATSVDMKLRNKIIRGKEVEIRQDSIVINDAMQTTCLHTPKCNKITSKRVTIYPEWGDVVNDQAVIYFFFVPVMYVPNYVSDMSGTSETMLYSAIPRFGYNPVEGNFAKAGISYYYNEKFTGTFDLHYLSKLGLRTGFSNNYKFDQANRGQFRLHYLTGLGGRLSYGWQHRFLLGVPYKDRKTIIDDFFKGIMPPSNDNFPEFVFDYTSREMVGYQWVSYKPKFSLISPYYELWSSGLLHSIKGSLADIYEEDIEYIPDITVFSGNRHYVQTNWEYNIKRPFDLYAWGRLVPGVTYSKSGYYENSDPVGDWKQFYYYLNYDKEWDKYGFDAGYKNTFSESGNSLLNYESFTSTTAEETNFGLSYQATDTVKLFYSQYYSITERRLRDRVYGSQIKVCDWLVNLGWSDLMSQFTFGITLD